MTELRAGKLACAESDGYVRHPRLRWEQQLECEPRAVLMSFSNYSSLRTRMLIMFYGSVRWGYCTGEGSCDLFRSVWKRQGG